MLTIVSTTVLHRYCVEVSARLNGKTPRNFTVDFNRRGEIICGYMWIPELGYLSADNIPEPIKAAAKQAFDEPPA